MTGRQRRMKRDHKAVRSLLDQIAAINGGLETLDSVMFSRRVRGNLVNHRRAAGMTQHDLAEKADMSIERVREIEETPFFDLKMSTAARYAMAVGVTVHMEAIPLPPEPGEEQPDAD